MANNLENQYNNDLEPISKIIGGYGDQSVSKIITQDKEMLKLMNNIYNIIENEAGEETFLDELEELLNAYTARGMRIAYLTGFRDCTKFQQEVNSLYENQ